MGQWGRDSDGGRAHTYLSFDRLTRRRAPPPQLRASIILVKKLTAREKRMTNTEESETDFIFRVVRGRVAVGPICH
jgi:hypothetical protein